MTTTTAPAQLDAFHDAIERAARIVDPWPGFPTEDSYDYKFNKCEKEMVEFRKEAAATIRSLTPPPTTGAVMPTREEVIDQCAKIAIERASKLRAKAKSMQKPHNQSYFAQSIEARCIADLMRSSSPPGGTIYYALRDSVLEQAAKNLKNWYPDNINTNAFCAAIRSMKSSPQHLAQRGG